MIEYLAGVASLLGVPLSELPAEIAARGWVPDRATPEGNGFESYIQQDFLPGDSRVPQDPLNPTTLWDLTHWRRQSLVDTVIWSTGEDAQRVPT